MLRDERLPKPEAQDTMSTAMPTPIERPSTRRPLVLVAEDSSDMRSLLTDVLESEGCDVVAVSSGTRALAEMGMRRPDLVITDLLMPGMSGFTLRSLMLKRPELAAIPVIVLSAYWHRPSETLDVDDVITKPINIDRLVQTVRRLTADDRSAEPAQ
jgi:CheY-like chemotaxis protein